ncbi:MAG: hypothetical protein AAFN91_00915 [Pseudomonadota bacterium]
MAKDHEKETIHQPPKSMGEIPIQCSVNGDAKHIEFDYEHYAKILDSDDLSEQEKLELLQALWSIMREFAMLGFGVHPIQQACGKQPLQSSTSTQSNSHLLYSGDTQFQIQMDDVVDLEEVSAHEGVEA